MTEKKKIKILRIINRFNIGGPTYNATFLTRFISDDFETLLVGGLPEQDEQDSLHIPGAYGLKPILIPELKRKPDLRSDRAAYKKIRAIIEDFQPDIVHTHAAKAGAIGRRAAISAKVPVVVHTFHGHVFHSYFGKMKTWLYKTIERRLARKSNGIIAISNLQKIELAQEYRISKEQKIKVIPLGFDLRRFSELRETERVAVRSELYLADDEVAVAIIGRLAPVKDHLFFLKVIEYVAGKTKSRFRVFIVGDGSERSVIEREVQRINARFPGLITLTSWITDIARFNAGIDIVCLTSKNEGTPVSLIEAQASGIPVLSTDVGGVRDVVRDGETGFIIPVGELETYARQLRMLIDDEKMRLKMSQNGWSFVRDRFHYERLVHDMEEYYKELLQKSKRE
jgi:glycosyltransferase involved in cell wall biosynthesis